MLGKPESLLRGTGRKRGVELPAHHDLRSEPYTIRGLSQNIFPNWPKLAAVPLLPGGRSPPENARLSGDRVRDMLAKHDFFFANKPP